MSLPATRTSIGAGAPIFSTPSTRLPEEKKVCSSGISFAIVSLDLVDVVEAAGLVIRLSATCMKPVCIAELGENSAEKPGIDADIGNDHAHVVLRDDRGESMSSSFAASSSVASSLVPDGALKLMTNWPASVRGKNDSPKQRKQQQAQQKDNAEDPTSVACGRSSTFATSRSYRCSKPSKPALNRALNRAHRPGRLSVRGRLLFVFSRLMHRHRHVRS